MKQKQNKNKKGKSPQKKNSKKPKENSVAAAYASDGLTSQPQITRGTDKIIIRHREFVGKVLGSVYWAITKRFTLNPGLPESFPWLSIQAQGWERYRFRRLAYRYITRVGSQTAGSVMMVPEYDVSDGDPVSEEVACSYQNAMEFVAWRDTVCHLDVKALNAVSPGGKFIRANALAEGVDLTLYDSGRMLFGASDTAVGSAGSQLGKIWVEYEVELITPQMRPGGFVYPLFYSLRCISNQSSIKNTGINEQSPSGDDLPVTIVDNVITFRRGGKYLIMKRIGVNGAAEPGATFAYPMPVVNNGATFIHGGYPLNTVVNPDNQLIIGSQNGGILREFAISTPELGTLTFSDSYTTPEQSFQFANHLRIVTIDPAVAVANGPI